MRTPTQFIAGGLLAAVAVTAAGLAFATQVVSPFWSTPVTRTERTATGQRIEVPAHPSVIVSNVTIAVHGRLPVHKHPHQRYAYVLQGTLTVAQVVCPPDDTASGVPAARPCTERGAHTYKAGEFFAEMRDTWHTGRNAGDEWVKLVVIDQVPAGTTANMVLHP